MTTKSVAASLLMNCINKRKESQKDLDNVGAIYRKAKQRHEAVLKEVEEMQEVLLEIVRIELILRESS